MSRKSESKYFSYLSGLTVKELRDIARHWAKSRVFRRIPVSIRVGINNIFRPVLRLGIWYGISRIFRSISCLYTLWNIADIPGVFLRRISPNTA